MGTNIYLKRTLFSTNLSVSLSSPSTAILTFLRVTDRASNGRCTKRKEENVQKNKSYSNYHEENREGKVTGKCISESDTEGKILNMNRCIHCTLEGSIGKDKELYLVVRILGR